MRVSPIERERVRRESAGVLRLIASPKRIASAARCSPRYAQMLVAGDRDNLLGRTGEFLRGIARERGRYPRALAYLKSMAMEGEMEDVREVAPEVDYRAALEELHRQMATAMPIILAEIGDESDPASMHETALDVAEAAETLMIRARQLQRAMEKGRAA